MSGFGLLRKLRPGDDRAFGATAEKLRRQGQAERAVEICREGLERYPEQLSARVTLGWALVDLTRYEEAKPEFEYVLRRAPDNLLAIRGMAHLHDHIETASALSIEQLGDWPPRQEDIDRAVADRPGTAPAEPVALAFEEPAWTEAPVVESAEAVVETAAELLEEAEALDALAAEAEAGAAGAVDSVEPLEPVKLDAASDVGLDAIATELTSADSPGETLDELDVSAVDVVLDDEPGGDHSTGDSSALHALEELLTRARSRQNQVSKDSAA
jgi:hypothetical protein